MAEETRYFIEIEIESLQIIRVGSDERISLDGGKQTREGIHRIFISKGQFNKFVGRCGSDLDHVLDG